MPPPDRCEGCDRAAPPDRPFPEIEVVTAVLPSDSLEAAAAAAAVAGDDSELEFEVEPEEGEEEEAGVVTVRAPAAVAAAAAAAADAPPLPPPPPTSWKPSTSLFMLSIEAWMRLAHSVTCECVRHSTMLLG